MIFFWRAAAGTLLLTGGFRCPPPCGKIAAPVRGHPAFNARLPSPGTLRPIPRLNSKRFLSVPFGTPKGTEKGPATSDSARLAAHNERRHPAKRARSCASKPHRGFDCFATAQHPGLRALVRAAHEASLRAAGRALKNLTKVGLAAARRRFLYTGLRSR